MVESTSISCMFRVDSQRSEIKLVTISSDVSEFDVGELGTYFFPVSF